MSGDEYVFGDKVTMDRTTGSIGIVKNGRSGPPTPPPADPALQVALQELLRAVQDMRGELSAASTRTVDDSLPALSGDAGDTDDGSRRHGALMAIAGIAATVGAVGRPVLDAVNKILDLLGAG